jgi:hypothetical protein
MAYIQKPKSPACKALVGNQHKLPQHLQEKILASPAKQTTAGEFAYEQHRKDMEMGKATYPIDKVKAAFTALTSDNVTYSEAKKQYRKERKKEYEKKNPPSVAKKACWDNYKMVGMKNKGGKQVPNCVPKK